MVTANAVQIENDLNRNTLHDFCEIARRIVWRKQAIDGACSPLKTVNFATEFLIPDCIYRDFYVLPRLDAAKLRLFKIGNHPNVGFNDRHDRLCWLNSLSGFQGFFAMRPSVGEYKVV